MNKLFIDTSTQALIVILAKDNKVIDKVFEIIIKDHSSRLMPSIEALLERNNKSIKDIDAIYVTEGPGSYTGVRIGVTVSKMLSYSLNKPLYKISTLKVISASFINKARYIVPLIDARRGNVFASLYKVIDNKLVNIFEDKLYNFDNLYNEVKKQTDDVLFVGLDSNKFIKSDELYENSINYDNIINLDYELVHDVHSFVPNYQRLAEAELNLL